MAAPEATVWDPFGCLDLAGDGVEMSDLLTKLAALAVEGEDSPPRHDADAAAGPSDPAHLCPACGCTLETRVAELENVCPECGLVREAAEAAEDGSAAPNRALQGRLRVVGRDANYYQPDLDRTNPADTTQVQRQALVKELTIYNNDYVSRGGDAFPGTVLDLVAGYYQQVKSQSVRRSNRKREIIATLLYQTCLAEGFARKKGECADFAQLPRRGVAKGRDYIRMVYEDRAATDLSEDVPALGVNLNCDQVGPFFNTVIYQLGLAGGPSAYAPELAATRDIVAVAVQYSLGITSILQTKVHTATYEVLRRRGIPISLERFVQACPIRKNTMNHFMDKLSEYHESHFVEVYRAHGLSTDPPPARKK